jgi:hypothetical protein
MQQIVPNLQDGIITIYDKFDVNASSSSVDETPYFTSIGSEYIISFVNLQNVKRMTKFTYDTIGLTDARYLRPYYRVSRDGNAWTEWLDLKRNIDNFPVVDPLDPLYLDIKWVRNGTSTIGNIRILEYKLEGELERVVSTGDSTINLRPGENVILSAPFIYKVFKINDVEIISPTGINGVDIKYRYSQDSSRTWSNWEVFTKENISTVRINPIRFFQIEYSITNNSNSNISIQDINLIGDFQNVSNDYFKTNLYGIRECCQSNLLGTFDSNGQFIPANNGPGLSSQQSTELPQLSTQDQANLFNPYQQNTAMNLLNKLSADAEQVFGHKVIYFSTDPDKRGQDHTLHEYQLYNVVCEGTLKVSVDGNNFPDSQIVMNQFDLSLFESMTVHITKKQFKEIFGPQRRPAKEDFLYFCDVNRMFQVDHAQQFRNFNNAAVYYKLVLKKYTQKANVQAGNSTINDKIKQLTKNSTIDELFGVENLQDKAAIANKDQFKPLTKDPIRLDYSATIDKELIENSSTIISKAHYDLSSITYQTPAVRYKNFDPILNISDNIGYQIWFKINNYIPSEIYNFMDYYDNTNSKGWKVNLSDDRITVTLNNTNYTYDLLGYQSNDTTALEEDVWYCYVANIDQRNRKLEQYIYKRNVDDEDEAAQLSSTVLRRLYKDSQTITPISYEMESINCQILASDMRATNIRLFLETIPEDVHNKVLNQYIIRDDSKYLVFADNATTRLYLPNFPLFE